MFKKSLGLVLLAGVLSGCAAQPNSNTRFTSFDDFFPGPEDGVDLVWAPIELRDETVLKERLAEYDSVIVDRIIVVISDEDQQLDDSEIQELVTYMQEQLKNKLSSYKDIVEEPSPTTLRLSIAISNVETPNPILAVTSSVLPFGIGMSAISKITTGEHTNVGSASIELLVSDSSNGQPIFAAIDREVGDKDLDNIVDSFSGAKDAIRSWVERLGRTVNTSNR